MKEKVSIIIPVYNTEKYLEECLDSVLSQSYKNLEIIIVNDGSTDGSPKILENYKKRDSRIVILHQKNQGLLHARKSGVLASTGTYIIMLDSDDYMLEDEVWNAYQTIKKYQADLVKFRFQFIPEHRNSSFMTESTDDLIFSGNKKREWYHKFLTTDLLNPVWNQIFHRKLYDLNSDIFEKRTNLGEDVLQNLFLYDQAEKIVFSSFLGTAYRYNPNSITKKKSVEQFRNNLMDLKTNVYYTSFYIKKWKLENIIGDYSYRMLFKIAEQIQNLFLYTKISKSDFLFLLETLFEDEVFLNLLNHCKNFSVKRVKDYYIKLLIQKKYVKIYRRKYIVFVEQWIKRVCEFL